MTELNAKFRYVQLCRSLKTYRVTFFLVKKKVPKKNKMVKILLGVSRDSVMHLDAETKEVLKVWSLTTLHRWAASPNRYSSSRLSFLFLFFSLSSLFLFSLFSLFFSFLLSRSLPLPFLV